METVWQYLLHAQQMWCEGEAADVPQDANPWRRATASQLLKLLKLLDVEQQSIATFLDVSVTAVSFWVRQHRRVPAKYRPALLAYAQTAFQQALTRTAKDLEPLPEGPRLAATLAWCHKLDDWRREVCYTEGLLEYLVREDIRAMAPYAVYEEKPHFAAEDRQQLLRLCQAMQEKLRTLEEMERVQEEAQREQEQP